MPLAPKRLRRLRHVKGRSGSGSDGGNGGSSDGDRSDSSDSSDSSDNCAATLELTFHVPAPPLRFDPFLPSPHQQPASHPWRHGRGFEVTAACGRRIRIAAATLGADGVSVLLALADAPPAPPPPTEDGASDDASDGGGVSGAKGAGLTVAYAMTRDREGEWGEFNGGRGDGRVGHLCDSDDGGAACAQTLTLDVERGSAAVRCREADGFARRAVWDVVEFLGREGSSNASASATASASADAEAGFDVVGAHEGDEIVVLELPERQGEREAEADSAPHSRAVLSRAWRGASGRARARVRHNQRNYCIAFNLPVDGRVIEMEVDEQWSGGEEREVQQE